MYNVITEVSREAIMSAYFKKTTFTGGNTYLSFYGTEDPSNEITTINRRLVPSTSWSVEFLDSRTTQVTNTASFTFGPLTVDELLTGYLITNAASGPVFDINESGQNNGTGIMAVRFPQPNYFEAQEGMTLKVPIGSILINLTMEDPG